MSTYVEKCRAAPPLTVYYVGKLGLLHKGGKVEGRGLEGGAGAGKQEAAQDRREVAGEVWLRL